MKRISKASEPADFSAWKANLKGHRVWSRVRPPLKQTVHEALLKEQGFICCYCEASVGMDDSHIEHFRPRRFSNLQLDYSNLHCSCQREPSAGAPHHCGYAKNDWFDHTLLVSPMASDCQDRFKFNGAGVIGPRRDDDAGAKTTIRKLCLDLPKLRALRAAALEPLYLLPTTEIKQLLKRDDEGRFVAFYSTIKQVLLS